jgi:hypothetical protein
MSETPNVDGVELDALREFFDCWCAFHEIQLGNRQQQERAAQRMVDAAALVKSLRPRDATVAH